MDKRVSVAWLEEYLTDDLEWDDLLPMGDLPARDTPEFEAIHDKIVHPHTLASFQTLYDTGMDFESAAILLSCNMFLVGLAVGSAFSKQRATLERLRDENKDRLNSGGDRPDAPV